MIARQRKVIAGRGFLLQFGTITPLRLRAFVLHVRLRCSMSKSNKGNL